MRLTGIRPKARLCLVGLATIALLAGASPASASHSQSTGTGGGTVYGHHDLTQAYPPVTTAVPPDLPCAEYSGLHYTSEAVPNNPATSDYAVAYSVTDSSGQTGNYTGLVTTEYDATSPTVSIWENPLGSFETLQECRDGTDPGHPFPVNGTLRGGALYGTTGVGSISCSYSGTLSRVGLVITIDWTGNCTVSGVTGTTHETRTQTVAPVGPAPTSTVGTEVLQAS